MTSCPSCQSDRIRRSHTRWWEFPRRWAVGGGAFRCLACRHRFWRRTVNGRVVSTISATVATAVCVTPLLLHHSTTRAPNSSAPKSSAPHASTSREPLDVGIRLLSARDYTGSIGNLRIVEGSVENVTTQVLYGVEVVCSWFNEHGALVASESEALDAAALDPGGTSSFRVMTRMRDDLGRFVVTFKAARR